MARVKLLPGHITFIGVYCNERTFFGRLNEKFQVHIKTILLLKYI